MEVEMSSRRLFRRIGLIYNGSPRRHWSAESERYAPVDVLLAYLQNGWCPDKAVFVEAIHRAHACRGQVFHFTLRQDSQMLCMPVLATPAVFRVIAVYKLIVQPIESQGERSDVVEE
jgi:hypothetical protein